MLRLNRITGYQRWTITLCLSRHYVNNTYTHTNYDKKRKDVILTIRLAIIRLNTTYCNDWLAISDSIFLRVQRKISALAKTQYFRLNFSTVREVS